MQITYLIRDLYLEYIKNFYYSIIKRQINLFGGFTGGTRGKEPACQCRRCKKGEFSPWVGKISWRRAWKPGPVFLSRESHGQRRLMGYGP